MLNHLLNIAPQRSIILLEDIDAALDKAPSNAITFSGLLNALDGVAATEGGGRILFMTTNHIEKLHPALIRPGRIDVKECLDLASTSQILQMFLRFFPEQTELGKEFVSKLQPKTVSTAQLQGFLMGYKSNPNGAVQDAHLIYQKQ
jgi:chaperone BCS1